jgi:hypothetical protein
MPSQGQLSTAQRRALAIADRKADELPTERRMQVITLRFPTNPDEGEPLSIGAIARKTGLDKMVIMSVLGELPTPPGPKT